MTTSPNPPFMVGTARFELANGGLPKSFLLLVPWWWTWQELNLRLFTVSEAFYRWTIGPLKLVDSCFTTVAQPCQLKLWTWGWGSHNPSVYDGSRPSIPHLSNLDTSGFEPVLSPCGGDVQPLHYWPWSTERSTIPQHPRWQRGILPIELSMHFFGWSGQTRTAEWRCIRPWP